MKIPMFSIRPLIAACAVLVLAGCTVVKNTLTAGDVKSFHYTGTQVSFAPGAKIWWGDGERAFAASKGLSAQESDKVANTSEGKAYLRGQIASKIKAAMDRNFEGKLNGTRPVRVEVVVQAVVIPSVAQRVIIGGTHTLNGDVNLVDARTGAVLLSHPGHTAFAPTGNGLVGVVVDGVIGDDPMNRVTNEFARLYRMWVLSSLNG